MARFSDEGAISEIVGALLLVVVVSTAAFSFGVFIHQQQKDVEKEKAAEQARQLEKLSITAVAPVPNGAHWGTLDFTVQSLHLKESTLSSLRVNGTVVKNVIVNPGADNLHVSFDPASPDFAALRVPARGQVVLRIEAADTGANWFSFVAPVSNTFPLGVEIQTSLLNRFEKVFTPPTAILVIDTQGTVAPYTYVLDGSRSDTANENGFIVDWHWSVNGTDEPAHGRRIQSTHIAGTGNYTVELDVTDNFGMVGTTSFLLKVA
jgi:hypothetical protein